MSPPTEISCTDSSDFGRRPIPVQISNYKEQTESPVCTNVPRDNELIMAISRFVG